MMKLLLIALFVGIVGCTSPKPKDELKWPTHPVPLQEVPNVLLIRPEGRTVQISN